MARFQYHLTFLVTACQTQRRLVWKDKQSDGQSGEVFRTGFARLVAF